MEKEIWKDVFDYPEYFMVSSHGRVWSKRTNKILKQTINKKGYCVISTRIGGRKGKAISKRIHIWVANAFIENPDEKPFVNHKDGDKTNNFWRNLEWCNNQENLIHAYENKLAKSGSEHCNAKFICPKEITSLKEKFENKEITAKEISKKFNIHKTNVYRMLRGETYKYENI